jgi:hypothetical protein
MSIEVKTDITTDKSTNILCKILYVEPSHKHHQFICRNIDTRKKFEVYTKYEYFYEEFKQSNDGLNLNYWYSGGFRQIINRLIEFETELIWREADEGDNGPHLVKSDDQFCKWLKEHHQIHSEHHCCDFDDGCSDWVNEKFPNRNTESPIEDI